MAVLMGGMAPFRGRVGTVVGYSWMGRPCIRAYRSQISYPNTEAQQQQKTWFVAMVRFASAAVDALRLGYGEMAKHDKMTVSNVFVRENKLCFDVVDGKLEVDYAHLKLADGFLPNVGFHAADFGANEVVEVEFDKHSMHSRASSEDLVYVYIYCPDRQEGMLAEPVARRSKRLRTVLPQEWAGHEVHLFGFVVDKQGRTSKTAYIGVGRVNHYEERGVYIPINKGWDDFVAIANRANGGAPEGDVLATGMSANGGEIERNMPSVSNKISAEDPPEVP